MAAADELDVDRVAAACVAPAELHRRRAGRRRRGRAERPRPAARRSARARRCSSSRSTAPAARAELCGQRQVADRRLRQHSADAPRGSRPAARGGLRRCGRPARARAGSISSGSAGHGGHDVLERHRPLAAAVEPAVLDVPDGEAARGEIGGHAILEVATVFCAPAAAVHEHDARVRAVAGRQPEIGDLLGVRAVAGSSRRAARLNGPAAVRAAPRRRASSRGSSSTAAPARAG